uniref:Serine/threonine-protein kinase STE20 n=1 Tax=Anthurium amnicola TaxID=1678845 RepID=A0A1D1XG43_9ARAE
MASRSFGVYCPLARPIRRVAFPTPFLALGRAEARPEAGGVALLRGNVVCSAVQESSTATVSGTEAEPAKKEAAEKPKRVPPAKAAVKSLPQLMEEDVIPSLRSTLQAQEDISEIELSFIDNRLEGSFLKKDIPYCFWVFFPDGVLTGPKGFSLSSYGSGVSTVEPFLIDEKKITARHVVFWVEKRLAAQDILPVWKE